MLNNLITVAEAAERLNVCESRVRAMIAAKRLPANRVGRQWLIYAPDLALVAERKPGRPATRIIMPPPMPCAVNLTAPDLIPLIDWYGFESGGYLCGPERTIDHILVVASALESPNRYKMDATERDMARAYARERGWHVHGSIHTHPCGPVGPTKTDIAIAQRGNALHAVWHIRSGTLTFYTAAGIIYVVQVEYPRDLAAASLLFY